MRDDEHSLPRDSAGMVRADQIRWTPAAVPPVDDVDPLTLTETELLAYVHNVQGDARWLRALLRESLSQVAKLTDELKRSARVIEYQRQQLREQRERAA